MEIKHLRQLHKHDPENGSYGDCQRTAMAMVLGLPQLSIPNFGELYYDQNAWDEALRNFLDSYGLFEISCALPGDVPLEKVIPIMLSWSHGNPFVLGGRSEVADHVVVVDNQGTIIDPAGRDNPFVGPLTEPNGDKYWWFQSFGVKVGMLPARPTADAVTLGCKLMDAIGQDETSPTGQDIVGGMMGMQTSKLVGEIAFLLHEYVPPNCLQQLGLKK